MTEEIKDAEVVETEKAGTENRFISAEIHIIADGKTGGISVNAPSNHVIALGLLEFAKGILAEQRAEASRPKMESPIVRAGADALRDLGRVS